MLGTTHTQMLAAGLFCMLSFTGEAALGGDQKIDVTVQQNGETFMIDASAEVPVSVDTAWGVMTDFDHMTTILGNLTLSKVISRNGNTWTVRQEGVAKYGPFTYSFESDREIHLEPMKRIVARNLTGIATRMDSEAEIVPLNQGGVRIKYHIEMVPGSLLARMFGLPFVQHEVEEQLQGMVREMTMRRAAAESTGKTPALQD